jgi:hypothetical protein
MRHSERWLKLTVKNFSLKIWSVFEGKNFQKQELKLLNFKIFKTWNSTGARINGKVTNGHFFLQKIFIFQARHRHLWTFARIQTWKLNSMGNSSQTICDPIFCYFHANKPRCHISIREKVSGFIIFVQESVLYSRVDLRMGNKSDWWE